MKKIQQIVLLTCSLALFLGLAIFGVSLKIQVKPETASATGGSCSTSGPITMKVQFTGASNQPKTVTLTNGTVVGSDTYFNVTNSDGSAITDPVFPTDILSLVARRSNGKVEFFTHGPKGIVSKISGTITIQGADFLTPKYSVDGLFVNNQTPEISPRINADGSSDTLTLSGSNTAHFSLDFSIPGDAFTLSFSPVCQTQTPSVCSSNLDCGTVTTGGSYCSANSTYKDITTPTCNNPGTSASSCSNVVTHQLQTNCASNQTCSNGSCVSGGNIACNTSSDCGSNGYTGGPFCQSNNVYKNFTMYTCNNPGTTASYCSNSVSPQFQNNCNSNQVCSNGSCNNNNNNNNCSYHSYQQCSGNNLYWFDSCGALQDVAQYCSYGQTCSGNTCVNNNNNNNCSYHSYQQCSNNAVYWYSSCGQQQDVVQTCSYGQTCSGNTCVNNNQNNSNLNVTVTVRNLSTGNLNWTSSVAAAPGDIVQFNLAVQSYSNQYSNSVTIRDSLPANLYYKDSLTLDGASNGGDITQGINIGSVTSGQTRNITYQAQVAPAQNFSFGTTTLTDSVSVSGGSYGYNQGISNASVIVTRSGVLGATSVSTGLTNNFWVDSFFLPLLLALMGLWAWRAGLLNTLGIAKWVNGKKATAQESITQNKLFQKISAIKSRENL